jgi:hypothetical protein
LDSGFAYEYYHYGPFSRDVVNATEDAKAFDLVHEEVNRRVSDGAPFSIFTSSVPLRADVFGKLGQERARTILKQLVREDATVLELAATAHWLDAYEARSDWESEIVRRKGVKCQQGRLEKAIALLRDLKLPPAVAA